ncbi:vacuolar import and degradation protein-domain-containing protein [Phellopilus nigrolimitatus]|nr:vacuolar import and degradation protein-domain-containing protein [Phellopilus nigrolimitatus]
MPSEHPQPAPPDAPALDDALQAQTKRCAACQRPLNADAPPPPFSLPLPLAPGPHTAESSESANFCAACRDARLSPRTAAAAPAPRDDVVDGLPPRRSLRRAGSTALQIDTQDAAAAAGDVDVEMGCGPFADVLAPPPPRPLATTVPHGAMPVSNAASLASRYPHSHHAHREPSPAPAPSSLRFAHPRSPVHPQTPPTTAAATRPTTAAAVARTTAAAPGSDEDYPDPLADITRLRVRSRGFRCLYPGATFRGTQKSGRNSYDVNVTIVDVDFGASSLCGYLRIRGLTDDWPELTTYFDAQIIGLRHGFDTQAWGATRQEDLVHWARFPAFAALRPELREPRLTLPANTARPAVFMRWKERFLVPDHRVQDISGASFAGERRFYYVCVDFDPQPQAPPAPAQGNPNCVQGPPPPIGEPVASMCGFYFHQNSEPYQQLSLTHVKDRFRSSFEFR